MNLLKLVAIIILITLILNLIAFALGRINVYIFWFIILGSALAAYYIIPNIKKMNILKEK